MDTQISIVVPVYKEEGNIRPFLTRLEPVLAQLGVKNEIIFVVDPGSDKTEEIILGEISRNNNIKMIIMSRRFGQPAATLAGIYGCSGQCCVVIDVDLQDPPEMIIDLYNKLGDGYEVVYATRRTRKGETRFKKFISVIGYRLIDRFSDVKIPPDTGDFRIMSRKVVKELVQLNDMSGYLRGLVAYVGFKQTRLEYDRDERHAGRGKYNSFIGSVRIGLNGLFGFTSKPLKFCLVFGCAMAVISFLLGGWYVLQKLLGWALTPGLSTTVLVVTFFSGIQLLVLGLVGEYVGRIYEEVKGRPTFIVDRRINFKLND